MDSGRWVVAYPRADPAIREWRYFSDRYKPYDIMLSIEDRTMMFWKGDTPSDIIRVPDWMNDQEAKAWAVALWRMG